ncbi:MAG: hypothetical protein NPIRA06_31440 [Nitrospirales bacterium]|nr:MAG: hypothetical protein NPIRA06_31440 [Nitrospirales bacterium]
MSASPLKNTGLPTLDPVDEFFDLDYPGFCASLLRERFSNGLLSEYGIIPILIPNYDIFM